MLISFAALGSDGIQSIESIEFFGRQGIDVVRLRAQLPVREGDAYTSQSIEELRRAAGPTTDVAVVCCGDSGGQLVFIGLKGANFREVAYAPIPTGPERLTPDILALSKRLDNQIEAAVKRGGEWATEDDSQGYALIRDPSARKTQLQLRKWALEHQALAVAVVDRSSNVDHRRIASEALGYVQRSTAQLSALVRAARDADGDVRNNATRALSVLARADAALVSSIDPSVFIAMLNSGIWSDRNKAAALLAQITAAREPALLEKLRSQAWDSLVEMSSWRRPGHAVFARFILGRLAGVDEVKLRVAAMAGPDFFSNLPAPDR